MVGIASLVAEITLIQGPGFFQVENTIRLQSLINTRYMMQTSVAFKDPFLEWPTQWHEECSSVDTGKENFKFKVYWELKRSKEQ